MSTCTLNEYEWMNEWMNEWMISVGRRKSTQPLKHVSTFQACLAFTAWSSWNNAQHFTRRSVRVECAVITVTHEYRTAVLSYSRRMSLHDSIIWDQLSPVLLRMMINKANRKNRRKAAAHKPESDSPSRQMSRDNIHRLRVPTVQWV